MDYRRCGKGGPVLSALGLGCWQFGGGEYWGDCEQRDADVVVRRAIEMGITYFDTAEAYNNGRSESALGRALKGLPRERLIIGSKVSPSNCYAKTLVAHCEASLRRLQLDWIDLYMIHWPIHPHSIRHFTDDQATIAAPPTVEEAFDALHRLKADGKIRHIGLSNFGPARLREAVALAPDLVVNQLPYSLLLRGTEVEMLPLCKALGVGVIGYMTLMQGVLTGRYESLDDVPPYQRRTRHFDARRSPLARHGGEGAEAETQAALQAIAQVAAETGLSMAALATKYALAREGIGCCLVGARRPERLEEDVRAAEEPLPQHLVERLDRVTQPVLEKLGPSFDYYEAVANDRTR
jgi:aryl-alcohol dehydrogenase-like predicted oxidoreductase